jgi:hypothetical protein
LPAIENASHAQADSNPDQLAALITQLLGPGRSDERHHSASRNV